MDAQNKTQHSTLTLFLAIDLGEEAGAMPVTDKCSVHSIELSK
jgi:hypothetical protein